MSFDDPRPFFSPSSSFDQQPQQLEPQQMQQMNQQINQQFGDWHGPELLDQTETEVSYWHRSLMYGVFPAVLTVLYLVFSKSFQTQGSMPEKMARTQIQPLIAKCREPNIYTMIWAGRVFCLEGYFLCFSSLIIQVVVPYLLLRFELEDHSMAPGGPGPCPNSHSVETKICAVALMVMVSTQAFKSLERASSEMLLTAFVSRHNYGAALGHFGTDQAVNRLQPNALQDVFHGVLCPAVHLWTAVCVLSSTFLLFGFYKVQGATSCIPINTISKLYHTTSQNHPSHTEPYFNTILITTKFQYHIAVSYYNTTP